MKPHYEKVFRRFLSGVDIFKETFEDLYQKYVSFCQGTYSLYFLRRSNFRKKLNELGYIVNGIGVISKSADKRDEYSILKANPVASFLVEWIDVDGTVDVLYTRYKKYCFETGRINKVSALKFSEMIKALGCQVLSDRVDMSERLHEFRESYYSRKVCKKNK